MEPLEEEALERIDREIKRLSRAIADLEVVRGVSAFDFESDFVGIGESIRAGSGINLTRPEGTPYIDISLSDVDEVSQTFVITSDDDDAHESTNNTNFTYTDAVVKANRAWIAGLRFTNVTVPQGATITSAYLTITPRNTNQDSIENLIYAEAADNPQSFATNQDVAGRTLTSLAVAWNSTPPGSGPVAIDSPNISAVIQEVIDRGGWESGNAIVIFLYGVDTGGSNLEIHAYNDVPAEAPELTIVYSQGTGSHNHDASETTYSPTTIADWEGGGDPGDVDNALDQLAERIQSLEGNDYMTLQDIAQPPYYADLNTVRLYSRYVGGLGSFPFITNETAEWPLVYIPEWGEAEDMQGVSNSGENEPGELDLHARADHAHRHEREDHYWLTDPIVLGELTFDPATPLPNQGFLYSKDDSGVSGLYFKSDDGTVTDLLAAAVGSYTDEEAQDAVGGILVDSSTIDFTYSDATPSITAAVIQAALDHGSIGGLADDDHPQYALDTDLTTHAGAADPHTGYRLESADHTHQSTGLQAGQLDHGLALTGLGDDDHTQYALDTDLSDHLGDISDAHDASAISILDVASQYTATDVEAALAEVLDALQAHEADTADAHDASAISILDTAGDFTATDVEGALAELQQDNEDHVAAADPHTGYRLESADHTHASSGLQGGTIDHGALTGLGDDDHTHYALTTELDAHLSDATDAHDASAISILDAGSNFLATEVESALAELYDALNIIDDHAEEHNHTFSTGLDASTALTGAGVDDYIDWAQQTALPSAPASSRARLFVYQTLYGPRFFYRTPNGDIIGPLEGQQYSFAEEVEDAGNGLGEEASLGELDYWARVDHSHLHEPNDHTLGGIAPLYTQANYVFVPDAAPAAVVTAGNQQGPVLHTGQYEEKVKRLYIDAETAPGASGLPITIKVADTNSLDTASTWTTVASLTLSSKKSDYTDTIALINLPANRLMRMDVGTIVGSPADVTATLITRRPILTWYD